MALIKADPKVVIAVLILVLFVLFVWNPTKKSGYEQAAADVMPQNSGPTPVVMYDTAAPEDVPVPSMSEPSKSTDGWGVATSMLPREIPSQEDFGSFSPDDIMRGQTYLDPRAQIGIPETLGGVLRNASWDIRSEPPNPRTPVSIFNNSTIVPDLMRPQFEIGRN